MATNQNPWAVRHDLEVFHLRLSFPRASVYDLVATGESACKRDPLWQHTERFTGPQSRREAFDGAAHLLGSVLLDRPRRQDALEAALRGGDRFTDVELPW